MGQCPYRNFGECYSLQHFLNQNLIIWYHLYNLKNVKNTYGGVLICQTIEVLNYVFLVRQRIFFFFTCRRNYILAIIGDNFSSYF